jgi:hypothetical protein
MEALADSDLNPLTDRDLLEEVVRALVSKPGKVRVEEREISNEKTSFLRVIVDPQDVGKVIGKQGRTADAIRTIFMSIASLDKRRVFIEVDEPERPRRQVG